MRENFNAHLQKSFYHIRGDVVDVESEWTMFKTSIVDAAAKSCGLRPVGAAMGGNPRTRWWTPTVREAVRSKKEAFRAMLGSTSPEARERYRQAKRTAAKAVAEAKARAWEEFGEAMEKDHRTASKLFWQTIRRLRRGRRETARVVLSKSGEPLTSNEDIVDRWKEHFEDLLNPLSAPSSMETELECPERTDSITVAEVTTAVKALRRGKAAGVDEIRPEMLKALDAVGIAWLTRLFGVVWREGSTPLDWQTGVVVPLFKKGDQRVCSNYRGITLLSIPGKAYARVLERRLRPMVEHRIQEEQCGFRPGRGTTDQLFSLSQIFEGMWEYAQPVYMCFVDLEKAYDRVPRGLLWGVLKEYDVPDPLRRAIRSLYSKSQSCVRVLGIKSKPFTVGVGLRQGCVLSPLLFMIFMDRISRRSRGSESIRYGSLEVSSLLYADDVILLASSVQDLQRALERFAAECEAAGMRISTSKSEIMVLSRKRVDCLLRVD